MARLASLAFLFVPLAAADNVQRCSVAEGRQGEVLHLSDGTNERCIAVVAPSANESLPVVFWFHGSGGNAGACGGGPANELGQLAIDHGFALVCAEALQFDRSSGRKSGLWEIPEIQTDSTGTPCEDSDSIEIGYIKNAIKMLGGGSPGLPRMDTSRIFTSGCSMGSAFSGYTASCLKARSPAVLSAFATHSTGLKTKGDGLVMPTDSYHPEYQWGECPKCQYFPFAPTKFSDSLGLKACVFDNTGDDIRIGDFYNTSINLVKTWKGMGMKAESHFGSGGHCDIHSYAAIVNCLDDGTKRLLPDGPVPVTPSPAPGPSPAPSPDLPKACEDCFYRECSLSQKSHKCEACVKANQHTCASFCMPYPFPKLLHSFCRRSADIIV